MQIKKTATIALISITWLWLGLTLGLSFIEAPIKFQAPGVTLPIGLGIGRLVFGVLCKIELALALLVTACLILTEQWKSYWPYFIAIIIVLLDNLFLLPLLDARAQIIINGDTPPESSLHGIYIGLEVVKLVSLLWMGIKLLKNKIQI